MDLDLPIKKTGIFPGIPGRSPRPAADRPGRRRLRAGGGAAEEIGAADWFVAPGAVREGVVFGGRCSWKSTRWMALYMLFIYIYT